MLVWLGVFEASSKKRPIQYLTGWQQISSPTSKKYYLEEATGTITSNQQPLRWFFGMVFAVLLVVLAFARWAMLLFQEYVKQNKLQTVAKIASRMELLSPSLVFCSALSCHPLSSLR